MLDFGPVKLDSARDTDRDLLKLSSEDSWSGTPGYMAPEVVLGTAGTEHRVDLYPLGCVAYWRLTGRMVFEGESAMQVMVQHVQAAPKRPSQRVDLAIPAALEDVVMECLEKDPARRPASADVVRERLDAVPVASVDTFTVASTRERLPGTRRAGRRRGRGGSAGRLRAPQGPCAIYTLEAPCSDRRTRRAHGAGPTRRHRIATSTVHL